MRSSRARALEIPTPAGVAPFDGKPRPSSRDRQRQRVRGGARVNADLVSRLDLAARRV